ncbi:hypothetical protein [Labilibaculum euxinus]|uniref:Uncharacterized protein n=1 Tax=Labilibaculum euxinus TaxID=2686357 RepID=A0A7M4DBM3_9BACT|nr:hypothetical protein [Labilibaculum euxinus]MUP40052.1 hypothetical protein [Labilibaculum euxinus]MVB09257.1 hypothetical protein [Labilibaculum euxinus]
MNFSQEEIYSMYGQFDTFVTLEFHYNTEEYNKFGSSLMGVFLYTLEERQKLEEVLNQEEIPRTDCKIKFSPSQLEKLSAENIEILDRYGIQVSSINIVSSFNRPRKNRFVEKGTKDIPNQITIQAPKFNGWQELNRVRFGFLNSILKKGQPFTPFQEIEYWGLRSHFKIETNLEDFKELQKRDTEFLKKVRLIELESKYQELTINEEQIEEFAKLTVKKMLYKKEVIDEEIQKSGESIQKVITDYNQEIEELRKNCNSFEEDIVGFGDKPIYLTFERFVHIYARHVSETQIGERFSGDKTVFQYKFDDIKYLIKMVVDSVSDEIQEHFKQTPAEPFRRMGKRAVYIDGHYYRLVIEPSGSILDFHPYNQNEE